MVKGRDGDRAVAQPDNRWPGFGEFGGFGGDVARNVPR